MTNNELNKLHDTIDKKHKLELYLQDVIINLEDLLDLQEANYEPYKERQTKTAIRSILNILGFTNLKAFHKGDKNAKTQKQKLIESINWEIKKLNPKTAKDIIFGLNIAKDIIQKEAL